ncbi:hypothetical protein [Coriobacterium glomerans]|uniref:hypothetical protein n=1 Tax=Coriobacterium glomerans TaxID=33871 RepID=UPI0002DE8A75|nr:hypothetical protein [Coriobacterium glomerans]
MVILTIPTRISGRAVAIAFSVAPELPSAGGASGLSARRGAAICALGAALSLMVPFCRRWRAL